MMQLCASAARLLGGRPILSLGIEAMEYNGSLPPRIILAFISLESAINARAVLDSLSCFHQRSVHVAGRSAVPAGTSPIVT